MNVRSETRDILEKVEELTGTPVEIIEDPTIPQLATIARAHSGVPFHLLRINSSLGEPDYLIIYECDFILRLYHLPPEERSEFAGSGRGRADVERWLRRAGQTTSLPETVRTDLAQQLRRQSPHPAAFVSYWHANRSMDPRRVSGARSASARRGCAAAT